MENQSYLAPFGRQGKLFPAHLPADLQCNGNSWSSTVTYWTGWFSLAGNRTKKKRKNRLKWTANIAEGGEKRNKNEKWRRWLAVPWHPSQSLKRLRCHWPVSPPCHFFKAWASEGPTGEELQAKENQVHLFYLSENRVHIRHRIYINLAMSRKWQTNF